MNRFIKMGIRLLLSSVLVLVTVVTAFAAPVRRMPGFDYVEQGFMALVLDAEGTDNFRYCGIENKWHTYRGKIKPGAKIKLVINATLGPQKSLPLTGRSCSVSMEVLAKKNGNVIQKNNYNSKNKSNLFLNYVVPENADVLEVNEIFTLTNKSSNSYYNKSLATRNRLLLSVNDKEAVASAETKGIKNDNVKTDIAINKKKDSSDNKEKKGGGIGTLAGIAAVAAAAGGGFFFMKKRKGGQTAAETKETLRWQEEQRKRETRNQDIQNTPNFCGNCGAKVEEGSMFCGNCGAKL